jgi:1-deoxy-D-xylulose-5-phosphate reductoisomerase
MRLPIQYALAHPRRLPVPAEPLNLTAIAQLTFAAVDNHKYPCLALACGAGRAGGTAPTVLNAANEVAVARFLADDLPFLGIAALIEATLEAHAPLTNPSLDEVESADSWAREFARTYSPGG